MNITSKFITIIRPEFMSFCQDACRAAAFNHILFRIAGKCKDQPKEKIQDGAITWYASNEQIVEEMSNAWGTCKVRKEINFLFDMGLFQRSNDLQWGANRTKHFAFGQKQCHKFLDICEQFNICFMHLDLPTEVKHLIYISNGNDKSIKCICSIYQMEPIDVSNGNDISIRAITKEDYQEDYNRESTYTQAANALAQSTHETANGESDAPTPTLPGHLSGDATDVTEHHVLPGIPAVPGDHRRADVSVDPQIALPSDEVSATIPAFLTPPTDEVSLLVSSSLTPVTGRAGHKATPASGAKPQRKPKVATGKTSTIGQSRISAIIDCMDATIQQLTGDPQFCFSRSKKAQDIIWDTLIKDRKEGQGVTPTMLRATITRMYNTPKDPRTGFDWKDNMSIAAICNNFDKFSIGLAAKQPPKVAPVELDAEALEEERRRLEFAIKHAERWAKPAPMAPAPHAVVPIVAKGSGR